jgi:hypothetical protein
MAGFGSVGNQEKQQEEAIRRFLRDDRRFRNTTPQASAAFCRLNDQDKSRKEVLDLPLEEDDLLTPPFTKTEVRRFNGDPQVDGKGVEVGNGFWVVRVASYREVLGSKVPDWEIELMTGRHSRMVFPAVIRERVIRHLGEEVYLQWKEKVLSTEDNLRTALTTACQEMDQQMAASWVTSPSSERLLRRMGITVKSDWGFLFKGSVF